MSAGAGPAAPAPRDSPSTTTPGAGHPQLTDVARIASSPGSQLGEATPDRPLHEKTRPPRCVAGYDDVTTRPSGCGVWPRSDLRGQCRENPRVT